MPKYVRALADTVYLPDVGITAESGEIVDLPDGFWNTPEQALEAGFALADGPAEPAPAPQPEPAPAPAASQE